MPGIVYLNTFMNVLESAPKLQKTFNVSRDNILSKKRTRKIVMIRHILMYLEHNEHYREWEQPGWSIIGKYYNRHHCSIMHAANVVENEIKHYPDFKLLVDEIQQIIWGEIRY